MLSDEIQTSANRAAAKWWANVIRSPKFEALSDAEKRDPENESMQLASVMAAAFNEPLGDEAIDYFEKELFTLLQEAPRDRFAVILDCDYGPCQMLADAAQKAGIDVSMTTFPWKTTMWIRPSGEVSVRYGYQAPIEILHEAVGA